MTYTPDKGTISTLAFHSSSVTPYYPTYIRLDPSLWTTHPAACFAKLCEQPTVPYRLSTRQSLWIPGHVDALYEV